MAADRIAQLEERMAIIEQRALAPIDDRRLSKKQVAERYGLTERSIDRRRFHDPGFPKPHSDSGLVWWWLSQLVAYDCALVRAEFEPRMPKHQFDDADRAKGRATTARKVQGVIGKKAAAERRRSKAAQRQEKAA